MRSQVKTKERVRQHGEVFTAEREVMAMMDLVKEDASNIDSTFFEPACGDGNFLAEILSRKMRSVFKIALSNDADCEYWAMKMHHYPTRALIRMQTRWLADGILSCGARSMKSCSLTSRKR